MKQTPGQKTRLSRKFILGITLILCVTFGVSLFVNKYVAERYYLYQQRETLRQIGDQLKQSLEQGNKPEDVIQVLEQEEKIIAVHSNNINDPETLSNEIRNKFRLKGLGFQKFWLWEEDYHTATQKGFQFRIYQQEKLNYSILVEYIPIESNLYAIAAIIPNATEFISMINQFEIAFFSIALLLAIALIYILVRHITRPLHAIEVFSKKIARQEYDRLIIHTGDELELVADSMNQMSQEIQQYQAVLIDKNRQMEQLLDNVAHDLKTPISLVNMYASGMRDGLDDGTFLDTILRQNEKMTDLVERLLHLSGIAQKEYTVSDVSLDQLLNQQINEQRILLRDRPLKFLIQIESNIQYKGNQELVSELFSNLLSNAVKYASGGVIEVRLEKNEEGYRVTISNETQNSQLDLERIWEPFYVGEPSRNSALTGTGLGLSLVRKIAEQMGCSVRCSRISNRIEFEVIFLR